MAQKIKRAIEINEQLVNNHELEQAKRCQLLAEFMEIEKYVANCGTAEDLLKCYGC